MVKRAIGGRRTNVLRGRPIEGRISGTCRAPAEAVYDLLADIRGHLEWGGTRRSKRSRLLSMQAPADPAAVGTEFASAGEDSMTRMNDRSVVTEAVRPRTFEFVTESSWFKRGGKRVHWTIVHHYDIAPDPAGSQITYSFRATRATSLPGPLVMFRVPWLRSIASRVWMGQLKGGMRNLLRMAEERAKSTREERRASKDRKSSSVQGSFDQEKELDMSTKGYIRLPGEGESYWAVGAKGTIKGPNVYEVENPPGWEVPLHVHDNEDEVHYYIEGEAAVTCGDETFKAEPGSLAFLPKGVPHALKFGESSPARWLWISPQNRDAFFREAGVPTSQPEPKEEEIDMERIMGIFEKYGMRFLEEEGH